MTAISTCCSVLPSFPVTCTTHNMCIHAAIHAIIVPRSTSSQSHVYHNYTHAHPTSHTPPVTHHQSHPTSHTPPVTPHTPPVTSHQSHPTHHQSHTTGHTPPVTPHQSHPTSHTPPCIYLSFLALCGVRSGHWGAVHWDPGGL